MSGLTTGVGPENGGCYRERMQRARRTLPNCYWRHEGMQKKLAFTRQVIVFGKVDNLPGRLIRHALVYRIAVLVFFLSSVGDILLLRYSELLKPMLALMHIYRCIPKQYFIHI